MTCGDCGRSWNDAEPTGRTPVPAGRCPYEDIHGDERMMFDGRPVKAVSVRVTVNVLSYVFADYPDGEIQFSEQLKTDVRTRIGQEIVDAVDHRAHHLTDAEDGDMLIVPAASAQIEGLSVSDRFAGYGDLPEYADVTMLAEGYAAETF